MDTTGSVDSASTVAISEAAMVAPPRSAKFAPTPEVQAQIDELRRAIQSEIDANRIPQQFDKSELAHVHWRDIYAKHRAKTTVTVTSDPRADPSYTSPSLSLSWWNDAQLHRFLVARSWSIPKARDQFIRTLSWRRSFGVDDLLAQSVCPFSDLRSEIITERFHHFDSAGRPIFLATYGSIDVDRLMNEIPTDVCWLLETWRMEELRPWTLNGEQLSVILDADQCTLHHRHLLPWLTANNDIEIDFYPEFLGQLFIINIPSFFYYLWNIAKHIFEETMRRKFVFLGRNYHAVLAERIGIDCLPVEWGGQCNKCGGKCLPTLAANDAQQQNKRAESVKRWASENGETPQAVTVNARSAHVDTVPIHWSNEATDTDTNISSDTTSQRVQVLDVWFSFELQSKDIDFTLEFHPSNGAEKYSIISKTRYTSGTTDYHTFTLSNANDNGEARLVFSNEFSVFTSKKITVQAGVNRRKIEQLTN